MPSFRSDVLEATSKTYGVFDTRPNELPKVGQRHHLTEKDFLDQANADWETHKKQFDPEVPLRTTTSGSTHGKIPFSLEPLGKRVIKSQDGKAIPLEDRDFEGMVDAGFMEPRQKNNDKELKQLVDPHRKEAQQKKGVRKHSHLPQDRCSMSLPLQAVWEWPLRSHRRRRCHCRLAQTSCHGCPLHQLSLIHI